MSERFIARQPIFDRRLRVFAYELLFRSGRENAYRPRPNAASTVIADSVSLFDLKALTGHARAFINVDEMALKLGAPRLLPADRIVVEILETVRPGSEIVEICKGLRADGYQIALDDFTDAPEWAPLVDLAHFLKIDFCLMDADRRAQLAHKYRGTPVRLLGEKIETQEELDEARSLGFEYYQGYFFCKPSMLCTQEIPGNKLIYLQLLDAVAAPELNYPAIERLLKQEASLIYRLLRYLNSPLIGLRAEVHSVMQAIQLLGEREFRRWVSIFALASMSSGKPPELARTALTRAYFCEGIAAHSSRSSESSTLFLMGLLSLVDALLDRPMAEVLATLPLPQEPKAALCGSTNACRDVLDLVMGVERGDWRTVADRGTDLNLREEAIFSSYKAAIEKAGSIPL